jgi:hypothetical protein
MRFRLVAAVAREGVEAIGAGKLELKRLPN